MKKPKVYAISDIHGNDKALSEVLRKVNFDYDLDHLYFLGDLADGYTGFIECINIFNKIKNFHGIYGNHDLFLKEYVNNGRIDKRWVKIGGLETIDLIGCGKNLNLIRDFFSSFKYYRIYKDKFLCHGGFNQKRPISKQKKLTFSINRHLYDTAKKYERIGKKIKILDYSEINTIVIGHSTTKNKKPAFMSNLINIDTGCGHNGYLTILDLDRLEYIQSSKIKKHNMY